MDPVAARCILFVVICTCNDISALTPSTPSLRHKDPFFGKSDVSGYIGRERRKRAVVIGIAAIGGIRAAKTLLKGSRPVPSFEKYFRQMNTKYTYYEKPGDYGRAIEDFYSVKPADVEVYDLPGGNVLTEGRVGDRRIIMRKYDTFGKPTLKLLQSIGTDKPKSELIIYIK